MMKDFGLVAVTFFGLIVAVFIAATLVRKEIEKRTVFVLFTKPVSRASSSPASSSACAGRWRSSSPGMAFFLFPLVWVVGGDAPAAPRRGA